MSDDIEENVHGITEFQIGELCIILRSGPQFSCGIGTSRRHVPKYIQYTMQIVFYNSSSLPNASRFMKLPK